MKPALALLAVLFGSSASIAGDIAPFMADRILYARICGGQFDREADAGRITRIEYEKLAVRERKQAEDYAFGVAGIYERPDLRPTCQTISERMNEFIKAYNQPLVTGSHNR